MAQQRPPVAELARYLAVYQLAMLPIPSEIIVWQDATFRVRLHPGPLRFSYLAPVRSFGPAGSDVMAEKRSKALEPGAYLTVDILAPGLETRNLPTFTLDSGRVVSELACLVDLVASNVLIEKLYEGFVNTKTTHVWSAPEGYTIAAAVPVEPQKIADEIRSGMSLLAGLPEERRDRFRLAARWYRRGAETSSRVDQLLSWWIALEIFPAEGNKKVASKTASLLQSAVYPDLSTEEIKNWTGLGRIEGRRGAIVHKGQAQVVGDESEILDAQLVALRHIVLTCLGALARLPAKDASKPESKSGAEEESA